MSGIKFSKDVVGMIKSLAKELGISDGDAAQRLITIGFNRRAATSKYAKAQKRTSHKAKASPKKAAPKKAKPKAKSNGAPHDSDPIPLLAGGKSEPEIEIGADDE